jgi:hypothetical protein
LDDRNFNSSVYDLFDFLNQWDNNVVDSFNFFNLDN